MKKYRYIFLLIFTALALFLVFLFFRESNIAVLNPKGYVALKQRDLIVTSTLLMLIVVLPVFALTFYISWKYRENNKQAKYRPDWDHGRVIESLWWAIPSAIIIVLALITWKSTQDLHPTRPITSDKKPLVIQVVALQWKWLFIYPQQGVAAVNEVRFPQDRPLKFEVTADAPMNSFWIPQLGGQIYAMPGMKRTLNLMASEPGNYRGSSANISGRGFAGMDFTAVATSEQSFQVWLDQVSQQNNNLSLDRYKQLAKPAAADGVYYFSPIEAGLYDKVVASYIDPSQHMKDLQAKDKMEAP